MCRITDKKRIFFLKMTKRSRDFIQVFSPATVANVGCGFDVFAFALNEPGDEIHLSVKPKPGIDIIEITGNPSLPLEISRNTASVSISAMLNYLNADFGIRLSLHKKMPINSGLGSSAASAVGGIFALNQLLDSKLPNDILLKFAIEGEKIASGDNVHYDNSAACLYGGFVLVRSEDPLDIISIPVPKSLYCVILHPQIEINTSESRKILPENVSLHQATRQWSNTAAVVAALYESDFDLLKRSITDPIIEPARAKQIPHFYGLRDTALEAGSIGCGISGSGPAVFALAKSYESAVTICDKITSYYKSNNIPFQTFVSKINDSGPKIINI
jgi:homoserine kinase